MLAVTYPDAGNLGGGGFATIWFSGKPYFLDYRERAPGAATVNMYLDAKGQVIPDASTTGSFSAGVPGTVMGLWQLHRRFARLPWSSDLAPAIRQARAGFEVTPMLSQRREGEIPRLAARTNFERYFGAATAGSLLRQPELARVLERIAANGPRGFYSGETARLIVAQMSRDHGLITAKDLASYRAVWREPLMATWAGYTVITAPPPSSGGIGLLGLLGMREAASKLFDGVALNSPQYIHLMSEMEKRIFADRAEYLGDPDYAKVPASQLTDPAYIVRRAQEISPDNPSPTASVQPGIADHHHTTHFSVTDRWGNAISNTYTLNDNFGSGAVVEGAGFILNNEMDDFSVKAGVPNIYGVVGGDANAIAPGKRPLSTMTPTILLKDNHVALVIGTPGGSRIMTSVFQVISNWHDFRLPLKDAVAALRVHHQLLPPDLIYEEPYRHLDDATRQALVARGYRFEDQGYNGDIEVIAMDGNTAEAVADPRGIGVGRVLP
jgi:gamma-glutamyltranspeptidase/glutathione hydrolase